MHVREIKKSFTAGRLGLPNVPKQKAPGVRGQTKLPTENRSSDP
jgi:hypothetical protein